MTGSRNGPDNRAALRFASNVSDRVDAWRKAGPCGDPECCCPAALTIGTHASPAPAAREVLTEARAALASPLTDQPERPRSSEREEP